MDKEWEVEASIEIKTSFWCETKEEAEKKANDYLTQYFPNSFTKTLC